MISNLDEIRICGGGGGEFKIYMSFEFMNIIPAPVSEFPKGELFFF